ncbi:MAG: hypothetical protein EXR99_10940 [Gemmataceae bacterium]|nr:hypothetical protein [Gemmataceae bacterium]
MKRQLMALTCVFFTAGLLFAADSPPQGNYKMYMNFLIRDPSQPVWLIKIKSAEGKLAAEVLATASQMPNATLENFSSKDGEVQFGLKSRQGNFLFEGTTDSKSGKILGSVQVKDLVTPAVLIPTLATSLDPFELSKESLTQPDLPSHEVVKAALSLLAEAEIRKSKQEEVRAWADRAVKTASQHGERWKGQIVLEVAELLSAQKEFAPIALQYARQAERALGDKASSAAQVKVLEILADVLGSAGRADEAKEVQIKLEKIDLGIKPEPFKGRKSASDRVVLVELFTGTECPPCVAADLAFDALGKCFKTPEVVSLQYHLHIPGPDPLTNPDCEARARYYGRQIEGTPAIFFNGKAGAGGGGPREAAMEKFSEYRGVIEPLLEKPAGGKMTASAVQTGDDVAISVAVEGFKETGNNIRLNMVLTEKEVRYTGGNKQKRHHHVVRSFPAGVEGIPLAGGVVKKEAKVNLGDLRKKWSSYLDQASREEPFSGKGRPLEFKNLLVVAFVQNMATGEVLQAIEVPVK